MAFKNIFFGRGIGIDSPASSAAAITLSDTLDLSYSTTGVYVGTAGDLHVTMLDGQDVTFKAVPAGAVLPIQVTRLWLTGTTVGMLAVAMW